MQRAESLSSASSFSSISDASTHVDTDVDSQTTSSKSNEPKRTRKRFSREQLIVLEQAYHKSTHPTREEREDVAKQADMNFKSVTIWFQNKRQAERKVALKSSTNRSAPPPLTMYPAANSTPLSLAPSQTSTVFSKTQSQSRIPARTASGFLSLDRIASRSERPPRTPTKLTRHASFQEPRSQSPEPLWESMLSSPIQPEKDVNDNPHDGELPNSPSARDLLDFASARGSHGSRLRGRRTLEWACAAARVTSGKEDDVLEELKYEERISGLSTDVDDETTLPDDDASTEIIDTEMESIVDSHEAITPESSRIMFSDDPSPTIKPEQLFELADSEEKESTRPKIKLESRDAEKDMDVLDAAWALCGLSMMRR